MIDYVGLFIGGLFLFFSEVFVWSKLYDEKINFRNPLIYFSVFFMTIMSIINHLFVNAFIKIISITIVIFICNSLIFKKKINAVFISTLYGQFIATIADSIFVLSCMLFFKSDAIFVRNNFFDTFIANFCISFIYIFLCYIPLVKKIYLKLVKLTEKFKFMNVFSFCFLLIVTLSFLVAIMYYDMKSAYVIFFNLLLIMIYSFIVYRSMNEKNINLIIKAENKSLMESLNEYENMVDRQRVDNHENKNQLLIIKNMIKKKDDDVVKYIDTIVKDEKEDDEALYVKVKTIPSGGLQGLIYQKMLTMKDEKIQFGLDVSRDVRKIDLSNFSMENNYKLCKILGVILDNAIEECRGLDEKLIMISLYIDDDLFIIDISNRYNGNIDVDKIDSEGYTTKGNGHGYGLSLVKKIVDESDGVFVNERRVTTDVFKQVIKVKFK